MKFIQKIKEGERYDSTIIGYKILNFYDAKSLRLSLYLWLFVVRIDIARVKKVKNPNIL